MAISISAEIATTSLSTVGSVFVIVLVGVFISQWPGPTAARPRGLLPQGLMKGTAALVTQVFIPCLSATTLGSQLDLEVLKGIWPIMLFGFANLVVATGLAYLSRLVARPPRFFERGYMCSITFGNVVAVPLVMLQTLCLQPQLQAEPDCFVRATSFAFVHLFAWSVLFWTVGFSYLTDSTGTSVSWLDRGRQLLNPPFLANLVGFVLALTPGLQAFLFGSDAPLRFLSSAATTLGQAVVPLTSTLMAASLGNSLRRDGFFDWAYARYRACRGRPAPAATTLPAGSRPALPSHTSGATAVAAPGSAGRVMETDLDAVVNLQPNPLLAGGTAGDGDEPRPPEAASKELAGEHHQQVPRRTLAALVITRIILVPAAQWGMGAGLAGYLLTGPDAKLAQLTLLIQSVTPTANLCVVVCQGAGLRGAAETIAQGAVIQYGLAIATLTIFTALSVGLIYPDA